MTFSPFANPWCKCMRRFASLIVSLAVLAAGYGFAQLSGSYLVPLTHEAIQYATAPVDDPVERFDRRLARGEVKLEFESNGMGHLRSVLKELDINVDSQVVVFSKTSFQAPRISPRMPRAIYFNDNVSVGWVRGGDVLEVAALDPKQGVIFYTLDLEDVPGPRMVRRDACLQCHQSGGTLGIPGLVVRSVFAEPSGMPLFQSGTFITDHRSPMKERWGGWYVSGKHGSDFHMGNAVVPDRDKPSQLETEGTQNLTSLARKFDVGAYLSPHSDIVALMTLEHQTHMTNLITRVGWETRTALHEQTAMNKALERPMDTVSDSTRRRINSGVEEILPYMLFLDEAPVKDRIEGVSTFTSTFPRRGPRDRQGRSLRDFDLEHRLFKHPLTYMVYSEAFDSMPREALDRLYRRLYEVLTRQDRSGKYAQLADADCRAILEILRDTKKNLPAYWRD
jgi:hypothetical protein